jgi:hypothetical protein
LGRLTNQKAYPDIRIKNDVHIRTALA